MAITSYTRKSLIPNERILYASALTNFIFLFPIILIFAGLTLFFIDVISENETVKSYTDSISDTISEKKDEYGQNQNKFVKSMGKVSSEVGGALPEGVKENLMELNEIRTFLLSILLIFIGVISLINKFLTRISTEMALTNKRVIHKKGFIKVDETEIPLQNIEGVKVKQSMVDRIFGKGTVQINGIGMEQVELSNISKPLKFKNYTYKAIDQFVANRSGDKG